MVGTLRNDHDRPVRVVHQRPGDATAAPHDDAVGPPILGDGLQPVCGVAAIVDELPADAHRIEICGGRPMQLLD
jgi:hypothetical protein